MSGSKHDSAYLAQYWSEQIKLKQACNLTRAAYCKKHGLNLDQFGYWERKLKEQSSELLPVMLRGATDNHLLDTSVTLCTLVFKSGSELRIHDAAILPILISGLR